MKNSETNTQYTHRNMALCQAAVAEAVHVFGKVDILFCCASEGELNWFDDISVAYIECV